MGEIREQCWWLREAMALPEFVGEPAPALAADTVADVLIVGGGYTGMWTAWQLKQRDPGLDVVLLEQDECGFGPSGRNGGFVHGFYSAAATLTELFGEDGALAVIGAGAQTVAELTRWLDDHDVDAWLMQEGYIGVASSAAQDGAWRGTVEAAQALGIDDKIRELTPEEMTRLCHSPVFGGGYHVADGGNVQPARLARGLRRVCMEAGVRIHEHTPVTAFRAGPPAEARTPGGSVRAD